jgi:hypothetical protein
MDWYRSRCDGKWEHQYGIKIGTLDNPGWELAIDLAGTELESRVFDSVSREINELDWYTCRREGAVFRAYCGPTRLNAAIAEFLQWASLSRSSGI